MTFHCQQGAHKPNTNSNRIHVIVITIKIPQERNKHQINKSTHPLSKSLQHVEFLFLEDQIDSSFSLSDETKTLKKDFVIEMLVTSNRMKNQKVPQQGDEVKMCPELSNRNKFRLQSLLFSSPGSTINTLYLYYTQLFCF